MKVIQTAVLILLVCGALSGAAAASSVTIDLWTGPNESERDLVMAIADAWNKDHPDIQVNVTMMPLGSAPQEYMAVAIAGGTAPDIFTAFHTVEAYNFAREGALLSLSQMKDLDQVLADRSTKPLVTPDMLVGGEVYFIPWQMEIILQEYNLDHLSELGFSDPPKTYGEFMEFARGLKTKDVFAMGLWHGTTWSARLADFYLYYLAASGGDTIFGDGLSSLARNETALEVIQFFRDLHDRDFAIRDYTGLSGDLFAQGQVSTQRWGNGAIPYFRENLPFEWIAGPIPVPDSYQGPEPPYSYANIKVVNAFSSTEHPTEVWQFLKHFLSVASDQKLLATGRFPVRADLASNEAFGSYFEQFPEAVPFAGNLTHARDVAIVPGIQEAMRILAVEFIDGAVTAAKAPKAALEAADNLINPVLREEAGG